MDIEVIGRIRPSARGEGHHSLNISGNHRITSNDGQSFSFQPLFRQDATNYDVYAKVLEPLLDLFLAGFNVSLLLFGETESGKSYTMAGDSLNKAGIVPLAIDGCFNRLLDLQDKPREEGGLRDGHRRGKDDVELKMSMYEIYNEIIKDLLNENQQRGSLPIKETAQLGPHLPGLNQIQIFNAAEATNYFRQGWGRRTDVVTDFGPALGYSAAVFQLELSMVTGGSPLPNRSILQVVRLPGAEKLAEDPTKLRMREGPSLNKSLTAFSQLVTELANTRHADRVINYTDSKLTHLMMDALGANAKTRVLCHLPPHCDQYRLSVMLRSCAQLSQVKNFPILNDHLAQGLVCQMRARILSLQEQLGYEEGHGRALQLHEMRDELKKLTTDNLQLRDKNERLYQKVEQLQSKLNQMAGSRTDLSSKLIFSEEEKLQVSKALVDLQIENNRIQEDYEAANFELKNKVLTLENELMEVTLQKDKVARDLRNTHDRLRTSEKDHKELADEYIILKTNYLALTKEHDREKARNEELGMELLNLVNATSHGRPVQGELTAEIDRLRHVVSRLSTHKPQDSYLGVEEDRQQMEKNLFGERERMEEDRRRMKAQYEEDQEKLEGKLKKLRRELQEAQAQAREAQRKAGETAAKLIMAEGKQRQLEIEHSKAQQQFKDLNSEYRTRLIRYVQDIGEYIDTSAGTAPPNQQQLKDMRRYIDAMIADTKQAYKAREEQLSQAAKMYKKQAKQMANKHEQLLVAYSQLREQVLAGGRSLEIDLGLSDVDLQLSDGERELHAAQTVELNRLRRALQDARAEAERAAARPRNVTIQEPQGKGPTDWSSVRKQLREFALNTQQELETDNARMKTKVSVLESQLSEAQDYIDKHLVRYKQEIVRLRKLLGQEPGTRQGSAGPYLDSADPEYYPRRRGHNRANTSS
ncbi:PREDICTED: coiled-coil domain-containing protein 78-like [Branchiostoma belcheri]|uniref:Coiled-coil domain-containing protein 78-like n=1 Tax=Branchiostoma belcheri TaxID=7741 RepID=A0A6P4ZW20_BRABE|nr:PREDICTED: coiled-coil domain-containing protein 78-like [Branchiostoma belcheri]